MANLASSAVSLYPATLAEAEFYDSKKGAFTRRIKLTGLAQGGATNTIGAVALGFKKLINCGPLYDVTNSKVVPAVVDPVNNIILLGGGASNAVGDVTTTTAYIVVRGT